MYASHTYQKLHGKNKTGDATQGEKLCKWSAFLDQFEVQWIPIN